MFASDILIDDEDIHALSQEDMDYFNMCKCLYTTPHVMTFKLFSLIRRGHAYDLPMVWCWISNFGGNEINYILIG